MQSCEFETQAARLKSNLFLCSFHLSLQTKVKEGLNETLGVAEKSISDAEAWDKPTTLSDDLEQATVQIQQSMVIIDQLYFGLDVKTLRNDPVLLQGKT